MVRSLYSGVTGMKAHQTRLDVIGNNIANVNTIGFKSSSATFRDVYYQSIRGAAAGTGTSGGVNPSTVGYGSQLGSIDLNMSQSANTLTGNAWDVAIGGEGFFQVQDADGNIYYTRAGKLGYDNQGYLTDSNGNYVLGTNAVAGSLVGLKPSSDRIKMEVPAVNPTKASATNPIGDIKYTITAGKETTDGNVVMNILSEELPGGVAASAAISSSGITVKLGSDYVFNSMADVEKAINDAIETANGGPHPAGRFTITGEPEPDFTGGLTGLQISSSKSAPTLGTVTEPTAGTNDFKDKYGFNFASPATGDTFGPGGKITDFKIEDSWKRAGDRHDYTITMTFDGGRNYTATINEKQMTSGRELQLQGPGGVGDTIKLTCPSNEKLIEAAKPGTKPGDNEYFTGSTLTVTMPNGGAGQEYTVSATAPSKNLGLGSKGFNLQWGTPGGPQTLADISGLKIGADGSITAVHRGKTLELGRIDLVTFENTSGLEQVGNSYFAATGNSGAAKVVGAGTSGTGALASSALEMSNVDLSQEFADIITTQRGFQANSRMITVSDTLLEELINLKR